MEGDKEQQGCSSSKTTFDPALTPPRRIVEVLAEARRSLNKAQEYYDEMRAEAEMILMKKQPITVPIMICVEGKVALDTDGSHIVEVPTSLPIGTRAVVIVAVAG